MLIVALVVLVFGARGVPDKVNEFCSLLEETWDTAREGDTIFYVSIVYSDVFFERNSSAYVSNLLY